MKTVVVERADSIDDVVNIAIENQISDKPIKISLSSHDFKVVYNDYLNITGEEIKVGELYEIGPVNIIFSKRRE